MWLLFGAVLAASVLDRVDRRIVVLAGVGLTVARMLPLALATAGGELRRETVLLLGVGPRGLASIVFARGHRHPRGPTAATVLVAVGTVRPACSPHAGAGPLAACTPGGQAQAHHHTGHPA